MLETKKRLWWWAGICLLCMLTLFLRMWNLLEVPPGLTHDEASNQYDASGILTGQHALYFPSGYGHEPLFDYSVALFTLILGASIFTLRFTAVIWSVLNWTMTVALAHRWWGKGSALITGAVIATSFWAQMMARVGLRGPVLPVLFTASVLFYDRAIRKSQHPFASYILSGIFLGASFYTYMASRGLPVIYLTFLVSQYLINRKTYRHIWKGTCLLMGIALLIGAPLFLYLHNHPELELRVAQLGGAITAFMGGNWKPLIINITDSLPFLIWRADPRWLYNLGGRAALEPLYGIMFVGGLAAILPHIKHRRHTFLLLWLVVGCAPALLTSIEYNTLHAIAAMPAVFLFTGYGIKIFLQTGLKWAQTARQRRVLVCLLVIAFTATGIESMHAYFVRWGQNRDVRVAYHHHVVSLGRELVSNSDTSPVVITSLYPGRVHDPMTMDIVLEDKVLPLRWADGRSAIFIPSIPARLYVEEQTALPSLFWSILEPDIVPGTSLVFRADDIPSKITGYRWNSPSTWDSIMLMMKTDFYADQGDMALVSGSEYIKTPVNFGDVINLNGYEIILTGSNQLSVLTAWSVINAYEPELNIFVHLLDSKNNIMAQQDILAAPSWQWASGDRILHLHQLSVPPDLNAAWIALGLYRQDNYDRLPIMNESTGLDRVFIHTEFKDL